MTMTEQKQPETQAQSAASKRVIMALLPLIIFASLAGVFAYQLLSGKDASTIPSALIGKQAPETELPPLEGLVRDGVQLPGITSADFKGQLTLLNVWASWCAPCRQEHPVFMELAKDKRIKIVGLNYKDQPENARRFLGDLGNPYAAVGTDQAGRSTINWGVYGVPETFLIGPDGAILYKHVGPVTPKAVVEEILPLVEKHASS
ncbi:DsbE family thiol:disulfide interchange protein [Paenochrobactrum gallinarii]